MTRKTSSDKDGGKASKSEGRDYMKLKNMLEDFVEGGCKEYHEDIDDVISDITHSGVVRMPWKLLKPLLRYKIDKILNESFVGAHSEGEGSPKQVLELLDKFSGPPFTIQRVCELILDPCKTYKRRDKYIRALQKNLLVVSTQEPDLIWMKVPNLSQLLDPKSSPCIPMPTTSSPDATLDKEHMVSLDLPSPSWKLPRSPISPRSPRSPRSRTPPPDFESSFAGRNWEGLLEPHPILFRKRPNSSLREIHTELHVQLQEADSTVPDQPLMAEEEMNRGRKRHRTDSDEDSTILKAILSIPEKETVPEIASSPEDEKEESNGVCEPVNSSGGKDESERCETSVEKGVTSDVDSVFKEGGVVSERCGTSVEKGVTSDVDSVFKEGGVVSEEMACSTDSKTGLSDDRMEH